MDDTINYGLVAVNTLDQAMRLDGLTLPLLIIVHDDGTYITGSCRPMVEDEVPFADVPGEGLAAVGIYGVFDSVLAVHVDPVTGAETPLGGKVDGLVFMTLDVTGRRITSIANSEGLEPEFHEMLPQEYAPPMEAAIARSTLSRA